MYLYKSITELHKIKIHEKIHYLNENVQEILILNKFNKCN